MRVFLSETDVSVAFIFSHIVLLTKRLFSPFQLICIENRSNMDRTQLMVIFSIKLEEFKGHEQTESTSRR